MDVRWSIVCLCGLGAADFKFSGLKLKQRVLGWLDTMACTRGTGLFAEALSHCRHGRRLRETITGLRVETYAGKSFEEVFGEVYTACRTPANKYGIGKLTVYDLAAAICRHHSIRIPHVYIIGGGPKRAVKLLGLETSIQHIGDVSLHYVEFDVHVRLS